MPVTYSRMLVTPMKAKYWLTKNAENNRNIKTAKIPMYARDMLEGKWNPDTGETIKFDESGTLIDGQNRLHAVIKAGVPIEFDIAHGLPVKAMEVIDSGASRTAADALKIDGVSSRMLSSSIVRWAIMWDQKYYTGNSGGGGYTPTNSEILTRYRAESGVFDSAHTRSRDCQMKRLGTGSALGTAHYLFYKIDEEMTHQFFDQFITGANLPERSPVLALRNRMIRVKMDRITRSEQLALTIRSWNFFRKGEPIKGNLIIARDGKLTNANFPQPK